MRRGVVIALPRRFDVMNAATRVAEVLNAELGGEVVGYKYKMDHSHYIPVATQTKAANL